MMGESVVAGAGLKHEIWGSDRDSKTRVSAHCLGDAAQLSVDCELLEADKIPVWHLGLFDHFQYQSRRISSTSITDCICD